jgi:hypothetical protein
VDEDVIVVKTTEDFFLLLFPIARLLIILEVHTTDKAQPPLNMYYPKVVDI